MLNIRGNVGFVLAQVLLALFAQFLVFPAHADFTGKVVAVADGDTLTVLRDREQIKVRLVEIDAPEDEAKAARRGLWVDADPMPPWEWRRQ